MEHAVRKIVITALATGGIVAGVATASAAPLRAGTSVSTLSAEEQQLHAVVDGLTAKELALRASFRARHHEVPAPVTLPTAPVSARVELTPTSAPAPTTSEPTIPTRHTEDVRSGETATTEPTSESAATEPTTSTTTEPTTSTTSTTTTVASTTTTTWPDNGGGSGTSSDG